MAFSSIWFIVVLILLFPDGIELVSVDDFGLSDGSVAEKGNDITLKCDVTITDSDGLLTLNVFKGSDKIAICLLYSGFGECSVPQGVSTRYSVSYGSPSMMILIRNVQISDGGNWYCGFQQQTNTSFSFTIYVSPVSLVLGGDKDGGDLQNKNVTLQCQILDCVYPALSQIQLFYKKASFQWLLYKNVTPSGTQTSCGDSEKKYTATLQLPRYTIWPLQPSNVETTVKFQCRLNFPTLQSPLQSAESGNVVFAVRVTAVTLKDEQKTLTSSDTTEAVVGRQNLYTCTPATSRPAATIVWYIGSTEKQRSTNTEYRYTPAYEDNNKQLYCKAFNIPGQTDVFSSKPVLSVKVKVTNVTLQDGNLSLGSDDEVVVTENQSKTLTCRTGNANPVPIIEWYFNGKIKQNGTKATFILTPKNNDHGKRIYCTAYNIQPVEEAVISANPSLYVRVLAGTPTLTNWTSGTPEFLTGEQVTLTCKSTATRPAVSVVWKKGTSTLSNVQNTTITDTSGLMTVTSTVTFTPEKNDNSENISCETWIPSQQPQKVQQKITVWWPPSTPELQTVPMSLPWLEGQNGKYLKCESKDYGNPDAEVIWISTVGTPAAKVLNLPTLTKYHHGLNVTCQLKNIYTEKMNIVEKAQIVQLDVQYKPDVFIYINKVEQYSVERNEGESLRAVCSAKGNPVPDVTWQRKNNNLTQLEFKDIDRKNHGGHKCIAQTTSTAYPYYDFSNEKTLQVTVNYAPNVTVILSNSNPSENKPLNISCNAVGRPNVYTYVSITQTWKRQTIREYSPHDGVLRISSVQLQDSGTYTCVVNNGIRDRKNQLNQNGERDVMIKVSPNVLLDKMLKFPGAVGTSVNITIPFFCHPEIRSVTFKFQNGTEIKNSSKYEVYYMRQNVTTKFYDQLVELEGYIAVLHISNEEVSDFANYTLTLENDFDQPKKWILEHVSESKPSAAMNLTYTGISNGVSTFSFFGGFNGGKIQTFIVETSVLGTENWIEQLRFNETDVKFHMDDKSTFRFNITGLAPNTYHIRVLSENSLGRIEENEAQAFRFVIEETEHKSSSSVAAIVGGCAATIVVITIVLVIILLRRKLKNKDESSTALASRRHRKDSESSDEVMTENLAYVSADEVGKVVKPIAAQETLYAQPEKKKKSAPGVNVKKNKTEDPRSLYAMPDKKDNKKGKKKKQQRTDDVYENASELTSVTSNVSNVSKVGKDVPENVYENPEVSKPKQKKNTNKDGLIYADLDFKEQPKGQKKLIIHGLDDMTEYITVDFTKKADPLPDSDEETNK